MSRWSEEDAAVCRTACPTTGTGSLRGIPGSGSADEAGVAVMSDGPAQGRNFAAAGRSLRGQAGAASGAVVGRSIPPREDEVPAEAQQSVEEPTGSFGPGAPLPGCSAHAGVGPAGAAVSCTSMPIPDPGGSSSAAPAEESPVLRVLRPGRLPYAEGLALQEGLVAARRAGTIPDTLVLLEHEAVITLGRAADPGHVLLDRERLARHGIALFETGRGGDVTLHSPGQVVGYPILALQGARRDTHRYLRDLEEVMLRVAADFGVVAERAAGLTGVWTGQGKLGAIGVRIHSGWITSHGFAFNVANDLGLFDTIVPCGIRGRGVTSLARLGASRLDLASLGVAPGLAPGTRPSGERPEPVVAIEEVMDRFEIRFRDVFGGEADTRRGEADTKRGLAEARLPSTRVNSPAAGAVSMHGREAS